MKKKDIVDLYLEHKDFDRAVKLSGLPALSAHIKLISSGVISLQDKVKYSSKGGKLGALAEIEFQKLVPNAVNYNTIVQKNNPVFDFKYGDLTIDVKYSSFFKRGNHNYWRIQPSKADLLVAFLETKKGKGVKDAEILIIPQAFIDVKTNLHITRNKSIYTDCIVDRNQVSDILADYNGLKG